MEVIDQYLDTIQEDFIEGIGAGVWKIGGPNGVTITLKGNDLSVDPGDAGPTIAVVGGAILALTLIKASSSIYKNFINKYGRQCRGYKGVDRKNCITRVRMVAVEKRIKLLQSAKGKCKIAKDPQKCVSKITSKIEKLNNDFKMKQASLMKVKKGV